MSEWFGLALDRWMGMLRWIEMSCFCGENYKC